MRRPKGNNRSVVLYDSINVYVPINGFLAFGKAEIVMLSAVRQVYYKSVDGSSYGNGAGNKTLDVAKHYCKAINIFRFILYYYVSYVTSI